MAEAVHNFDVQAKPRFADKAELAKVMREHNRLMDFVPDAGATIEGVRRMMFDCGIRPDDNEFSRSIVAARDDND